MLNRGRLNRGGLVEGLKNHRVMNKPPRYTVVASYINGSPLRGLPTTSRATVSPMYADGSGDLVQYAANNVALVNGDSVACWPGFTNLIAYSEEFENAAWTKTRVSASDNQIVAPDGTTTGCLLTDNDSSSSGDFIRYFETVADDTVTRTYSVYLKVGTANLARVSITYFGGTLVAETIVVDLSDGTISSGTGTTEDVGDGWYRFSVTLANNGTGNTSCFCDVRVGDDNEDTGTVYVWGAQLTQSSYLLPYVPTAGSSVAVDPSEPVVPWPSGLDINFAVSFKFTPDRVPSTSGSDWAMVRNIFSGDYQFFLYYDVSATKFVLLTEIGGTLDSVSASYSLVADTQVAVVVAYDGVHGKRMLINGSISASGGTQTAEITMASTSNIGHSANGGDAAHGTFRDVKIHGISPNITSAELAALA